MNRFIRAGIALAVALMLVIGASGLRAEHDAATPAQGLKPLMLSDHFVAFQLVESLSFGHLHQPTGGI